MFRLFLKNQFTTVHAELLKAEVSVFYNSAYAIENLHISVFSYMLIKTCYK
jgi:hypothetical protein